MTFVHISLAPADVEGNAETATVVDLFPWTEYEFRVIATNTLGTGEPSSPSPKDKSLEAGKIRSWHIRFMEYLTSVHHFILIIIPHPFLIALFTCFRSKSAEIPSYCAFYHRRLLPNWPHKPQQMSTLLKLYTEIQLENGTHMPTKTLHIR